MQPTANTTSLMDAVMSQNLEHVKAIINQELINQQFHQTINGGLIRFQDVNTKVANVRVPDLGGGFTTLGGTVTALGLAVYFSNPSITKTLLEAGADPLATFNGESLQNLAQTNANIYPNGEAPAVLLWIQRGITGWQEGLPITNKVYRIGNTVYE